MYSQPTLKPEHTTVQLDKPGIRRVPLGETLQNTVSGHGLPTGNKITEYNSVFVNFAL